VLLFTVLCAIATIGSGSPDEGSVEIDGYDDRGSFDSMSVEQLKEAARKQATAFGICTLTAKRLKNSICGTSTVPGGAQPGERTSTAPSEDTHASSDGGESEHPDLGEGVAEGESALLDSAAAEITKATSRILNGPSAGVTMLDKMSRSELIEFNKKSLTAESICQRSLLSMRKSCKQKSETKKQEETRSKVRTYGNGELPPHTTPKKKSKEGDSDESPAR